MFKVLVIDDEALVRTGIVFEIDWASIDCMVVGEAANGIEGLDLIRKYQPDLVISDIKMPKLDGLEMLKQLRLEKNPVQVIFLTAYSDFLLAQNAIKLMGGDYI